MGEFTAERLHSSFCADSEGLMADYFEGKQRPEVSVETLVSSDLQGAFTLENAPDENAILAIVAFSADRSPRRAFRKDYAASHAVGR